MKTTAQKAGSIIVVGLGPGAWDDLTVAARDRLLEAPAICFRTLRHPTVVTLRERRPDLAVTSFDDLYEAAAAWDELYATMVERLLSMAAHGPVIYAVPGHPLIGETSVRLLRAAAATHAVMVAIIAGMSFLEPLMMAVGIDPIEQGLQVVDATELAALGQTQVAGAITTVRPLIVSQVFNRRMASAAKLALLEIYPDDLPVTLIQAAGLPEERQRAVPLCELDYDEFPDHLTSLYVPAVPLEDLRVARTPEALRYVIARLRAPNGCPWDREQTHRSLLPFVLEEAAEVADAIETYADDPQHLAEELGDLLLQVYLHTEIAQEEEQFVLGDVFEAITRKLIRRHPHVFGEVEVEGAAEVVRNWEMIKREERAAQGDIPAVESRLKRTPRNMAALAAAQQIQRRAVKTGFDWPTVDDWLAKAEEEIRELQAAPDAAARADELGDILFTLVALARRMDLDAEAALRGANAKFTRRFQRMEVLAHERGLVFEDLDREAQVGLWREAKANLQ